MQQQHHYSNSSSLPLAYSLSHSPLTRTQRTASSATSRSPFVVGVDSASLWLSPREDTLLDEPSTAQEEEDRWALRPLLASKREGGGGAETSAIPSHLVEPAAEPAVARVEEDEYEQLFSGMSDTGSTSEPKAQTAGGDFELFDDLSDKREGQGEGEGDRGAACSYDLRDHPAHGSTGAAIKQEYPNYLQENAEGEETRHIKRCVGMRTSAASEHGRMLDLRCRFSIDVMCPSRTEADALPSANHREAAQLEAEPGPTCFPRTHATPALEEQAYSGSSASRSSATSSPRRRATRRGQSGKSATPTSAAATAASTTSEASGASHTAHTGSGAASTSTLLPASSIVKQEEQPPSLPPGFLRHSQPSFLRDFGDSTIHTPTREQVLDHSQIELLESKWPATATAEKQEQPGTEKEQDKGECSASSNSCSSKS